MLPGQKYSIVTAIAAGAAYCNAPPLIPQGQKRKMFLTAENFWNYFFAQKKAPDFFGRVAMYNVQLDKQEVVIYNDLFWK